MLFICFQKLGKFKRYWENNCFVQSESSPLHKSENNKKIKKINIKTGKKFYIKTQKSFK
jgi:hypothetical protein